MRFFGEYKVISCNSPRGICHASQLLVESEDELRERQALSGVYMGVHRGERC